MKKNKKLGIIGAAAAVIVLVIISTQFETESITTTLEAGPDLIDISGNTYGTISTSIGTPLLGSEDAPITIFVFSDYQCSDCKFWFENVRPNLTKNFIETGVANMLLVDAEMLGSDSLKASEATYCAEDQGKYWEYQQILFANQQEPNDGWASPKNLKAFASDLDLDVESFDNCLDSGKYEKKVKFNAFESKKNGVVKTPTFVVTNSEGGHHIIKGASAFSTFEQVIGFMR